MEITETVLPEQVTVPEMNTLATKVKCLHPLLPLEGGSPDRGTCVIERKCQLPFKSDCRELKNGIFLEGNNAHTAHAHTGPGFASPSVLNLVA